MFPTFLICGSLVFMHKDALDCTLHCNLCIRFHLYKENKDTQEALRVIGKMLGLQVHVRHCFIKILANSYTYSLITRNYVIHSHGHLGLQGQRINVLLQPNRFFISTLIYVVQLMQHFNLLHFLPLFFWTMWAMIQCNKHGSKWEL
jgi:hypothetical protein